MTDTHIALALGAIAISGLVRRWYLDDLSPLAMYLTLALVGVLAYVVLWRTA